MRKTLNPEPLFNPTQYWFSQFAMSTPGKIVFISCQVAWDENLNLVGENNIEIQALKVIDNLKMAIESVEGTMENIMMLRIYVVNYQPKKDGPVISSLLRKNFGSQNPGEYLDECAWVCR